VARIGSAVASLSALAALTACGGNDFADGSADEIVKAARADMGALTSVKVAGELTTGGQHIILDLQVDADGDCAGSIGVGGGAAQLLGVGGSIWMRPNEAFWRSFARGSADELLAIVGDKWVALPAEEASFRQFCDLDELFDQLLADDGSTYHKGGIDTVKGDDVVKIVEDSGNGTSTGYVLVDDPHYLVRIEKTEGDDGTVTFSAFDEELEVSKPAADDVVDLDHLSG
jgi:hypothetical protein